MLTFSGFCSLRFYSLSIIHLKSNLFRSVAAIPHNPGTTSILVRVSTAVMKHHDLKASWGRKALFSLYFHYGEKPGQKLKQSRNLDAGADVEVLFTGFLPMT